MNAKDGTITFIALRYAQSAQGTGAKLPYLS